MDIKKSQQSLIKNTGILAIGTFCSKIVSFLLLPIYTTALSTSDYGTVDVLQSIVSFALPLITLELNSAIFRFLIDNKNVESIISTTIISESFSSLIFILGVVIYNKYFGIQYCSLFIAYFITHLFLNISQNITRGFGNNKLYSLMNFTVTLVSVLCNIVFILFLHMGGDSILLSLSIAYLLSSFICFFRLKLWNYFNIHLFSKQILKSMLAYSLPLIPNAISWWIANTSDRLVIRYFLGANYNGIYAAANKIPTIYITIYNVYNLAWIESLARSAYDKNQTQYINETFQKSLKLFGCICLIIICAMGLSFDILIGKNYSDSYPHILILVIAIFINSLCSQVGGIFTSYKRSDIIGKTTVLGAITNIIINLLLIKYLGLFAASLSTLFSYLVILLVRNNNLKIIIELEWPKAYLVEFLLCTFLVSFSYISKNKLFILFVFVFILCWSFKINHSTITGIIRLLPKRNKKGIRHYD